MHAQRTPAAGLEDFQIAASLGGEERREAVRLAGNGKVLAAVARRLEEDAGAGAALVELSGRVQEARAESRRASEPGGVANQPLQLVQLAVEPVVRGEIGKKRDVVARLSQRQMGPDPLRRRPARLAQDVRVLGAAEERETVGAQCGLRRWELSARLLRLRKERLGLLLALGDVGLVEGIDLDHGAHHRGGDLPAEELAAERIRRRQLPAHDRVARLGQRLDALLVLRSMLAGEPQRDEEAILAVGGGLGNRLRPLWPPRRPRPHFTSSS